MSSVPGGFLFSFDAGQRIVGVEGGDAVLLGRVAATRDGA
jgi:hypothetical protein